MASKTVTRYLTLKLFPPFRHHTFPSINRFLILLMYPSKGERLYFPDLLSSSRYSSGRRVVSLMHSMAKTEDTSSMSMEATSFL